MASKVKDYKSKGTILGLNTNRFTVMHMDNLKQYMKHSRNPSKALCSTLVIGAQQPLPKTKSMELRELIDIRELREEVVEDGYSDEYYNLSYIPDVYENENNVFEHSDDNVSDISESESQASQYSQTSEHSQTSEDSQTMDYSNKNHYTPPITRSVTSTLNHRTDEIEPRDSGFELNPRTKRLRLEFESEHGKISKYISPHGNGQEVRQCQIGDFTLNDEETSALKILNLQVCAHSMLQMEAREDGDDGHMRQFVPSFKETMAWEQPITPKTDTVYLELIPGKPDTIDTLLYAISLLKELFVEKLGYKQVMVCGDGKTVNLLYMIKDEYGKEMAWLLVMLGTWHMLKDYLAIFLKKYENIFVYHLLSKVLTKGNVDAIIKCTTWWRSHNYSMWIISAVIREKMEEFLNYLDSQVGEEISELKLQLQKTVNILKSVDKVTEKVVDSFVQQQKVVEDIFISYADTYDKFMKYGFEHDDQFALFACALEDFQAYLSVYIAIRSSNWMLRIAGIKMMASRFVRSGAILYKWLVLRHLADIATYPQNILDRLKEGAWVSALKDGKGVTLARDEYHERTASKDIQMVMPKQLTDKNMQVLTQYVTYGATIRNNLLQEFFSISECGFEVAKGCSRPWLGEQEKYISTFQKMIHHEHPFKIQKRTLKQPFTTRTTTNDSLKQQFFGRNKFGESRKDYGNEILVSFVVPRFCRDFHDVASEKVSMPKKTLTLFPLQKKNKRSKESKAVKEKEEIMEVLAAGIIKMSSSEENSSEFELPKLQISRVPGLIAENDDLPYRKKIKSDMRSFLQNRYSKSFVKPQMQRSNTIVIRDSMQDIFLAPLKHQLTFKHYFDLFWEIKIRTSFSTASTVVIDFDRQRREKLAPKDALRNIRDGESETICDEVSVDDDELIPAQKTTWPSFLANRENKARLVLYICKKLEETSNRLQNDEELYVSYEGIVTKVTPSSSKTLPFFDNNHDESDTRIFFICALMNEKDVLIRSTDSDILFNALLNHLHLHLHQRKVVIHYTKNAESAKYCHLNELVNLVTNDHVFSLLETRNISSPMMIGILHFITGCDDLSFLRGFTKNFCLKIFLQHCDKICPETPEECAEFFKGETSATESFFVKFLICLYCQKFACCFSPGDLATFCGDTDKEKVLQLIRNKTWHKTIITNNQLPAMSAISLHSTRISYVIKINGHACFAELVDADPLDHGWIWKEESQLLPKWDTEDNKERINVIRQAILKKCACKKSRCIKWCGCRKNNAKCTNLCSCYGCQNTTEIGNGSVMEVEYNDDLNIEANEDEESDNDTDDDYSDGDEKYYEIEDYQSGDENMEDMFEELDESENDNYFTT